MTGEKIDYWMKICVQLIATLSPIVIPDLIRNPTPVFSALSSRRNLQLAEKLYPDFTFGVGFLLSQE